MSLKEPRPSITRPGRRRAGLEASSSGLPGAPRTKGLRVPVPPGPPKARAPRPQRPPGLGGGRTKGPGGAAGPGPAGGTAARAFPLN